MGQRADQVGQQGTIPATELVDAGGSRDEEPAQADHTASGGKQGGAEPESVEEARAQIVQTRAEMGATIDAIQERLDPQRLKHQAEERVQELATAKVDQVR